ncbi:hypothetical protein RND71_028958 [Anisodus tanguticus]|uniref:SKP1 component dimerisation domain-containing protein n=1 Tax=Anisodus tanguticus TaxID=243964 RepID=A0AAE1VAJ0_9SOLA|nr:hypothetical protein RND71_028958 [Anisodus tanguticus]
MDIYAQAIADEIKDMSIETVREMFGIDYDQLAKYCASMGESAMISFTTSQRMQRDHFKGDKWQMSSIKTIKQFPIMVLADRIIHIIYKKKLQIFETFLFE